MQTTTSPDPLDQVPIFGILPDGLGRDFWAVPAPPASGYSGGCAVGSIGAQAYLELLRARGAERSDAGILQLIALRMAERLAKASSKAEATVIHGHIVGFFGSLDFVLKGYAPGSAQLDRVTFNELRQQLQQALTLNEGADLDRARHARDTAIAKKGWRTRRRGARRAA